MGPLRSEAVRRRASTFYQGGSLAFGAAGIYVVATLAERMNLGHLGWVIAAMVALPSLVALAAPKQDVLTAETAARSSSVSVVNLKAPSSVGRRCRIRWSYCSPWAVAQPSGCCPVWRRITTSVDNRW